MFRTETKLLLQIAPTGRFPIFKHLELFFFLITVPSILVNLQDNDEVSNFEQ